MFDHIGIVVSKLSKSRELYTRVLDPLGFRLLEDHTQQDGEGWLVYGAGAAESFFVVAAGRPSFWTAEYTVGQSPIHCAFVAPSQEAVNRFHELGLANGAIDNARKFYVDVIGFSIDFDAGDVVGLLKDEVLIMLISEKSENVRQPAGSSNVSFLTYEVDALYDRCVAARADILVAPGDRPYGQRDFAVKDPDGSVLNFGCAVTS